MSGKILDRPVAHLALIALLGLLVYSNAFETPFTFDDRASIVDNPLIKDVSNIPSLLTGRWGQWASRPILHVSTALNFRFGGLDTTGYHAVNIATHLINGILLYFLVAMTCRRLGYGREDIGHMALFSALLFIAHPVQTEAVTYIVNRSMLFATAFYLLGMILFIKAVTSEKNKGLYAAGLFVVSLLGMGSRENFSTFPLMLFLYDMLFISRLRIKEAMKHYKAYLPVLLSLGYLAYLVSKHTYLREAASSGITPSDYALTQLNVHWTYLRLLLLPINQNLYYDYATARTLSELTTILSFLGYLALWAGGILLLRRRPPVAFAILWFLITLVPISFAVTLMDLTLDDVIFEHRLYLPGAALFPLAAALILHALEKLGGGWRRAAAVCISAVLVVALASAAFSRNVSWRSETSLWEDVVKKSPNGARGHFNLGNAYAYQAKDIDRALEHLSRAVKLDPDYADAHFNLGLLYLQQGMEEQARIEFEAALQADPNHYKARMFLDYIAPQH